ncbi:NADPH-dependent 7-cyano-7-deazaguanine reductase QueF [bacterium]|jgi:7-cyano-7-deazaguanine reductase|nr:NADPH-dependent 7-cyano-7-deazaguanine reductase QueF [bacterium]
MTNQNETHQILESAPLGKKSSYINTYTPSLLFPLPRKPKRDEIGLSETLPFQGFDLWTGFEISWLNLKGKPMVAVADFKLPAHSRCLIESKSFKLYLNSFNNSKFESLHQVREIMISDLSKAAEAPVEVSLFLLSEANSTITTLQGQCLDHLDVECTDYQPNLKYLKTHSGDIEETLHTNLLKSNCLVTGQPDWGSVEISYRGKQIDHEGLLQYIVSLRDHNEFHEQCVERIFVDITNRCAPEELSVLARYTRRGGLDINPYRTNKKILPNIANTRLVRQ